MDVTVHIPDETAARLASAGGDLSRRALEALTLEEYKSGHITDPELLLLSRRQGFTGEERHAINTVLESLSGCGPVFERL
jgi:hypothetical protein